MDYSLGFIDSTAYIHILENTYHICLLYLGYFSQDDSSFFYLPANFILPLFKKWLSKTPLSKCTTYSLSILQLKDIKVFPISGCYEYKSNMVEEVSV